MDIGASTPEELETLLEDGFLRRDAFAVARLFEEDGLLVNESGGQLSAGRVAVLHAASVLCGRNFAYLAEPRSVWRSGDIALLVGARAINVVRRGRDGYWRYVISNVRSDPETRTEIPRNGRVRAGPQRSRPLGGGVR